MSGIFIFSDVDDWTTIGANQMTTNHILIRRASMTSRKVEKLMGTQSKGLIIGDVSTTDHLKEYTTNIGPTKLPNLERTVKDLLLNNLDVTTTESPKSQSMPVSDLNFTLGQENHRITTVSSTNQATQESEGWTTDHSIKSDTESVSTREQEDMLDSFNSTRWPENDMSTESDDVNGSTEATRGRDWIHTESKKYILYWAGWYIHLIWLPIIVPIGMIGNLLSFLIMMQRKNRRISCCLYMAALAICDSVALFRKGYEWLIFMFGKPYVQSECQILAYLGLGSIQYGMFLIVGMTVDRVIAIKFPLKANIYCTPFRAKLTIFIFLIVSFLFNIPHYVTSRQIGNPPYTCATLSVHLPYIEAYAWASTVINFFIPFIGLTVMNVIIVSTIRNRAKSLNVNNQEGSGAAKGGGGDSAADRQLAVMLCLVGFFFIILNMPQCIRLTMFLFMDRWESPYNHAVYIFVFHFSNKTYYTNNGINFFLYCIGGRKFRDSLRELCCCCCASIRRSKSFSSGESASNKSSTISQG